MSTGLVICATRGGEASRSTQEHAIALARERGAELVFLYVADCGFAGLPKGALLGALQDELMNLGHSLLALAQARAARAGLEAQVVVLCGPVRATIREYLLKAAASVLVLGASGPPTRHRAFSPEEVLRFAESLVVGTGVEVHIVTAEGTILRPGSPSPIVPPETSG